MRLHLHFVTLILLAALGCSGSPSSSVPTPTYDPDAIARAAIKQYDKNGNGILDAAELEACPALKGALTRFDSNKDGSISSDELKTRFQTYRALGSGTMSVVVDVKMNGRALTEALVTFIPEDCMLGAIQGGSGATDGRGMVNLSGPGGVPGLPCGLYRITVSKKGSDGKETVPAKFNTETTLGREISADPRSGDSAIHLELK